MKPQTILTTAILSAATAFLMGCGSSASNPCVNGRDSNGNPCTQSHAGGTGGGAVGGASGKNTGADGAVGGFGEGHGGGAAGEAGG